MRRILALASLAAVLTPAAHAYPHRAGPPPHAALWQCIHASEGAWNDRDSGGNGHWGGLQMHPGWGYGTSWHASDDSPLEQMWAAERGYRASRYSHAWLGGQWGQTVGRCWRYA